MELNLHLLVGAMAAVVLFLHALEGFSAELQAAGGDRLRRWLGRATASRWRGFVIGAGTTAVVQSSSAVTSMAVALVNSGALNLQHMASLHHSVTTSVRSQEVLRPAQKPGLTQTSSCRGWFAPRDTRHPAADIAQPRQLVNHAR